MTASGGNFIECEFNRNKRAPQWGVAPIEVAEDAFHNANQMQNSEFRMQNYVL